MAILQSLSSLLHLGAMASVEPLSKQQKKKEFIQSYALIRQHFDTLDVIVENYCGNTDRDMEDKAKTSVIQWSFNPCEQADREAEKATTRSPSVLVVPQRK